MSHCDDMSSNDEMNPVKSKISSKKASNTPSHDDDGGGSWYHKIAPAKTKKASITLEQRDTQLKKVESSKLIWAKCHFFKSGPFFPARIADVGEAMCQKDIPTSIPPNFELVEFFCLPTKNPVTPRFIVCKKNEIVAFDAALNGRKQLTFNQSYAHDSVIDVDEFNWDVGRMDILRQVNYLLATQIYVPLFNQISDLHNHLTVSSELLYFLFNNFNHLIETEREIRYGGIEQHLFEN